MARCYQLCKICCRHDCPPPRLAAHTAYRTAAWRTAARPVARGPKPAPDSPARSRYPVAVTIRYRHRPPHARASPQTSPHACKQGSSASAAAAPTSGSTENPPAIAASPGAAPVAPVKDSAHDDPFALDKPATARTAPASADELLQQARKSVGHIDQQLRAESPQRFYRRQTACRPGWNVASMRRGSGAAQVVSGCTHGRAEYVGWRAQIPSI
jgi:hypothetical protein